MKAGHSAKSLKPADLLRNHLPTCNGLGCRLAPEWGADLERILHNHPNFTYHNQNACDLSRFKDDEFDLAISIGMLEHITEHDTFQRITSEIQRVAKQYIIIVPYKYCWIEPHYGVPFFPILPYSFKLFIVKAFNLSNHRELLQKDRNFIKNNYRWLSNAEYRAIFKGSVVYILPTLETIAIIKKS